MNVSNEIHWNPSLGGSKNIPPCVNCQMKKQKKKNVGQFQTHLTPNELKFIVHLVLIIPKCSNDQVPPLTDRDGRRVNRAFETLTRRNFALSTL